MTQDIQGAERANYPLVPVEIPTPPELPPIPDRFKPMVFDSGRQACGQTSEGRCIATLVKFYGWSSLGEDTLRRYRRFTPCPADMRTDHETA
jgi:hypothetical protein